MDPQQQRRWLEQWRSAGAELEEVRKRELRELSESEALAASENLLSLAFSTPLVPRERWITSGLVEQQALLHGLGRH